ncbi:MAG: YfhO family protein [Patescibacteria group bacterium]|nr:YfhO family protein [Patescibacteria group bacterium]MCL5431549.1 YfhO family protein [Patescibacteria group bacterium]
MLLVVLLSLLTVVPLFHPGFFVMHDFQQVVRLAQLDKALSFGQFPVRWVADLGFGYGYNLFNFYPPLVYYLGEIIHLVFETSFLDATKIIWGIALVGSALSMYFLAKEFFGKVGGLVSAMFYLYIPYHAVDAYVRGALAELFSFVWLPLILLFSYQKRIILTGITLALLMITHNLVFLPFFGLFAAWYLVLHRDIKGLALITLITFGLSAFFWLPSLAQKQFTLVDQFLTTGLASYSIHFVCPAQLWNSLWGYGGSAAGCVDGLSFKIGKPQVVLALVALLIAIWKRSKILLVTFTLFVFCVFMTTDYSRFIWDHVKLLWYLQFPWRFLEFVALFSSLLAGSFVLVVKKTRWRLVLGAVLIAAVIFLHGKYFVPQSYLPQATDATLLSDSQVKWVVSQTSFEYMPAGVAVHPTPQGSYMLDIAAYPTRKYVVTAGSFGETKSQFGADRFLLAGIATQSSQIQFQITNFPGWKVWVDGKATAITDNNKLKLITVSIPAGQHQITGQFTNTPVRTAGNLITLFAIIVLMAIYLYGRRRT